MGVRSIGYDAFVAGDLKYARMTDAELLARFPGGVLAAEPLPPEQTIGVAKLRAYESSQGFL